MSDCITDMATVGVWRNPADLSRVRDLVAGTWVSEAAATVANCLATPVRTGILWHYTLPEGVTAAVLQTGPATAAAFADLVGDVYEVDGDLAAMRAQLTDQVGAAPAQVVPQPETADQSVGYLDTYDRQGGIQGGVVIHFQMVTGGAAGQSHDAKPFSATSSSEAPTLGRLVVNLLRGAVYEGWRGDGGRVTFTAAGASVQLPEILGR
jgi:hypothetical protein